MYQSLREYVSLTAKESPEIPLKLDESAGGEFPVLTGLFRNEEDIVKALGYTFFCDIEDKINTFRGELCDFSQGFLSDFKIYSLTKRMSSLVPIRRKGPTRCQDSVKYIVDMDCLPKLHINENGNSVIPSPIVITASSLSGRRHAGLYPMEILGSDTAILSLSGPAAKHLEESTHRLPVAICFGGDPAYTLAAGLNFQEGFDKFAVAGFLRDKPVPMVQCFTQTLSVPADCDIVLEGYIQKSENVFHITCLTHRSDAVFPDVPAGEIISSSRVLSYLRASFPLFPGLTSRRK